MSCEYATTNFDRINAETAARAERKMALLLAFDKIRRLLANTTKPDKARALQRIIENLIFPADDFPSNWVETVPKTEPEAEFPCAADVAMWKALLLHEYYLNQAILKALGSRERHCQADRQEFAKQFRNEVAFAGLDVNSFVEVNGILQSQHKLSRQYGEKLPEEKFWQIRQLLHNIYCNPHKKIRVVWEFGMAIVNGGAYSFLDQVEVIARPIDPKLLDYYLFSAYESGLMLRSNLHFAAIECLVESGQIEWVSVLPRAKAMEGYNFASLRQTPKQEILDALLCSAVDNGPFHVE